MAPRAILLALAPALLGAAVVAGGAADRIRPPLAPISADRWQPRPGDVILTSADDLVGTQIRNATGNNALFSHVGLVVARGDSLAVIEATPYGAGTVAYADLTAFTTNPGIEEIAILRPRGALDADRLNREAARLADARVAFDYELDADDASTLYCAELVVNLLRTGGVDLAGLSRDNIYVPMTGERDVIMPNAFANVPALEPIARQSRPAH